MDVTNNKYYFPTEIEKEYVDEMKKEGQDIKYVGKQPSPI
jgi:hypothetical protein